MIEKTRTDGLVPTLRAVRSKPEQPMPMGYCNASVALEAGAGVSGFSVGGRVASNGKHAEIVLAQAAVRSLCGISIGMIWRGGFWG